MYQMTVADMLHQLNQIHPEDHDLPVFLHLQGHEKIEEVYIFPKHNSDNVSIEDISKKYPTDPEDINYVGKELAGKPVIRHCVKTWHPFHNPETEDNRIVVISSRNIK